MSNEELIERFETYIIGMRFGLHIEYDSQMYSKTKAELLRRLDEIDRLTARAEKAKKYIKDNSYLANDVWDCTNKCRRYQDEEVAVVELDKVLFILSKDRPKGEGK